jgi:energy-coupling factor transporter ATP-binding protein EcfA2
MQIPEAHGSRFASLDLLRKAHSDLLKRYREDSNQPGLFAEIEELITQGAATGAVLDREDDRWSAQSLLDYWASVLYRESYACPDSTLLDFDNTLSPEIDDAHCPYLGLKSFDESKKDLFFGREKLIKRLLKQVKASSLLAVIGSSGSGKSSLMLGGLIPRLKEGKLPESQHWDYYSAMVPGKHPIKNLAKLICRTVHQRDPNQLEKFNNAPLPAIEEQLWKEPFGFKEVLTRMGRESTEHMTILVIDQFEELFTLCDERERTIFIENLTHLIQDPHGKFRVILTIRSDFESYIAQFSNFKTYFEANQIRVTALDAQELRNAIEKPAESVGLIFEENLVSELISNVLGEPAALPLLQFSLLELWKHRQRNRITWDTYKRVGGGRDALQRSADNLYNSLIPEDQKTIERILLNMVRQVGGLEFTSKRVDIQELYDAIDDANDRIDRVLQKLMDACLIYRVHDNLSDELQVEVTHEALLRNWPRFVQWLETEKIRNRQRLQLTEAAQAWQERGRDKSLLWRGSSLAEAQKYNGLSVLEQEFVQASQRVESRSIRIRRGGIALITGLILSLGMLGWYKAGVEGRLRERAEQARAEAVKAQEEANAAREEAERARTQEAAARVEAEAAQAEAEAARAEADEARRQIERATTEQEKTQLRDAIEYENRGFQFLLNGSIESARTELQKAYAVYPATSIETINEEILTDERLQLYEAAEDREKREILREIFTEFRNPDLENILEEKVRQQINSRINTTIRYFKKEADQERVENALNGRIYTLGFQEFTLGDSIYTEPTNRILFGSEVDLETVKLLITELLKSGVEIKIIRPFSEGNQRLSTEFRIDAVPEEDLPEGCSQPWTLERVESLVRFSRGADNCMER